MRDEVEEIQCALFPENRSQIKKRQPQAFMQLKILSTHPLTGGVVNAASFPARGGTATP